MKTPALLKKLYTDLFFHDRVLLGGTITAFLLNAALWFVTLLSISILTAGDREYITLHYRIIFGTDFIARWFSIFLLPVTGLVILCINTFTSAAVFHIDTRIGRILCITSGIVQVILFFSLYLLIRINLY